MSIPSTLKKNLKKFRNKKIIFDSFDNISYEEFYFECVKFSNVLKKIGAKKNGRIGICMNKSIDQAVAIVGCIFAECIFVPILPKLNFSGIGHIIKDCKMSHLITDSYRYNEVSKFSCKVKIYSCNSVISINGKKRSSLNDLRKKEFSTKYSKKINDNNPGAIIYSSGSTGRPKGIVIPYKNFLLGAKIVSEYLGTKKNDRILGVLSLNFDYGLNQLWQCILLGCSIYFHELVFQKDAFDFIKKYKINVLPLMPVMISIIFNKPHNIKIKNVKYICTSGGPVTINMIKNLNSTFLKSKTYLMYGLTEAFRSTFLNPKKILKKFNSIGQAIPKVKIHVLDKDNKDCKANVPGELVHRGGCVALGYWKDKKNTKRVFKKIKRFGNETVVFSGDLVKKDKDGDIYFISRKDQMIKTSGYRVSPTEIEEEIVTMKNVKNAVAFGSKDEKLGQVIHLIYTTFNSKKISYNQLYNFGRKRLPSYMIPKKFFFEKKFPTTGNQGKIDRKRLIYKFLKND